jgi:hypothetical protein
MDNHEIVKLCQEIYKEHKTALDLIFENRPDRLQNVSEIFKAWCETKDKEGVLYWDKDKSSKSYVRFRTPFMDARIPKSNKMSGWNTYNHYYYEVCSSCDKNDNVSFVIQLAFSAANLDGAERELLEKIIEIFQPDKKLKDGWQWRTVFKSKTEKIRGSEVLPDDFEEDNSIYKKLGKMFNEIQAKEKTLEEKMGK